MQSHENEIDDFSSKYETAKSMYDYDELIHRKEGDIQYIKNFVRKDIDNMIKFMVNYNYMGENMKDITVKGCIASEINECNELICISISS